MTERLAFVLSPTVRLRSWLADMVDDLGFRLQMAASNTIADAAEWLEKTIRPSACYMPSKDNPVAVYHNGQWTYYLRSFEDFVDVFDWSEGWQNEDNEPVHQKLN